jgi:Flp pilus assembly pilin Flp
MKIIKSLWNKGKELKNAMVQKVQERVQVLVMRLIYPVRNQSGATIVEILGYALIAVLAIVVIWGLIKGWIPTMFNSITGKLGNLS